MQKPYDISLENLNRAAKHFRTYPNKLQYVDLSLKKCYKKELYL